MIEYGLSKLMLHDIHPINNIILHKYELHLATIFMKNTGIVLAAHDKYNWVKDALSMSGMSLCSGHGGRLSRSMLVTGEGSYVDQGLHTDGMVS